MDKSPDAFRTISEVSELLGTPAHVLRFWESRFPQIRPVKRAGGRRYYRPADVALLSGIRHLLHDRGVTIRGVQKLLREEGVRHVVGLGEAGDEAEALSADVAVPEPVDDAVETASSDSVLADTSSAGVSDPDVSGAYRKPQPPTETEASESESASPLTEAPGDAVQEDEPAQASDGTLTEEASTDVTEQESAGGEAESDTAPEELSTLDLGLIPDATPQVIPFRGAPPKAAGQPGGAVDPTSEAHGRQASLPFAQPERPVNAMPPSEQTDMGAMPVATPETDRAEPRPAAVAVEEAASAEPAPEPALEAAPRKPTHAALLRRMGANAAPPAQAALAEIAVRLRALRDRMAVESRNRRR